MPTQAAEHDDWYDWTASPISDHFLELAMRGSQPTSPCPMSDHSRNDALMPASVVSIPIGVREYSCIKINVARLVVSFRLHFRVGRVFRVNRDVCFQSITRSPSLMRCRPIIFQKKITPIAKANIFGSSATRYGLYHRLMSAIE